MQAFLFSKITTIEPYKNVSKSSSAIIFSNRCYLEVFLELNIFDYKFNNFVFALLYKFFCPSRIDCRHFLDFTLLFQMVVTTTFVGKWFVTD